MKWKHIKLRFKFLIGFGTIVIFLIFISAWSVNGIEEIITNGTEVIDGNKLKTNFAVVATEVKQLADKSHKAAEEVDKVATESVGIAENTINIFKSIVSDIN